MMNKDKQFEQEMQHREAKHAEHELMRKKNLTQSLRNSIVVEPLDQQGGLMLPSISKRQSQKSYSPNAANRRSTNMIPPSVSQIQMKKSISPSGAKGKAYATLIPVVSKLDDEKKSNASSGNRRNPTCNLKLPSIGSNSHKSQHSNSSLRQRLAEAAE